MNKQRLLVLTTTYPRWPDDHEPGFVHELCKRLTNSFDITVLCPHAPDAQVKAELDHIGIKRFRYAPDRLETLAYGGGIGANLKRHKWKYLLLQSFLLSFFFGALSIVRNSHVDVIHAHWMIPGGLIGAAMKILNPKLRLVVTAHGADVFQLKGRLFASIRRWVANEADAITVVGGNLLESAKNEGWYSEKVAVAPMGIDFEHTFFPDPRPHEYPTLVFAGRLVEKKGLQHLIEAMPLIHAEIPEARLLVAGSGPMQTQLKDRVTALNLTGVVTFLGSYRLSDLPGIFGRADIAVLPFVTSADGDREGFGLTTLEAMGCGLPVVVGSQIADMGIVENGVTGISVNVHHPADLAAAIIPLLRDPDPRRRIAANARLAVVNRYSIDMATFRYDGILRHR